MENKNVSIMYSGGLDSLIAYHYAISKGYEPICIWVNMGHDYAEKEKNSMYKLEKLFPKYVPNVNIINMQELIPLIEKRLSNQIIPSRNVMLATIGAMFSPRVWINALDGEQNGKEHDKSEKFFKDTTNLLTFTNEFFQNKTIIESPFSEMTKAETIKWALDNGIPLNVLFTTSSCYHPSEVKCGECLTCYKRYVAFRLNNIEEKGYNINPLETSYAKEMQLEIPKAKKINDYSRFTKKRIEEHYKLYGIPS